MKCESCGNELIGAAIICRACNHNNALHKKLERRRPEPRHTQSTQTRASGPLAEFPTIVPRKDAEVNLLHFPSALNRRAEVARSTPAESEPRTATYPPWRDELKERIRRIREKRAARELAAPNPSHAQSPSDQVGESKPTRNPIVESALNRIRWASPEAGRRGDGATERRRDGERERQRDRERESIPASPSFHPSVPPSLRPSISPSLRPPVHPSLRLL